MSVKDLRSRTAEHMRGHADDFLPFLTNPDTGDMYTTGNTFVFLLVVWNSLSGEAIKYILILHATIHCKSKSIVLSCYSGHLIHRGVHEYCWSWCYIQPLTYTGAVSLRVTFFCCCALLLSSAALRCVCFCLSDVGDIQFPFQGINKVSRICIRNL